MLSPFDPDVIDADEARGHVAAADTFDFRGAWAAIRAAFRHRRRTIWLTVAASLATVALYVVIWPPVYTSDVTLVAASTKTQERDQFYSSWAVFRRDDLTSEVQLFTSGPVLSEVVRRLNLHYDDVYHPPLSYLTHLWTTSWPGRSWRALKDWVSPPPPDAPTAAAVERAATLDDMRSGAALTQVAESNVGKLTVMAPSRRVTQIANTIVDVYLAQRRQRFANEAQQAYNALAVETDKARGELLALERRMQRYYSQNDMALMFEKDKVQISQLLTNGGTIVDLRAQLAQSRSELAKIRTLLAAEPRDVVSARIIASNPVRQSLLDKQSQLELARRTLALRYVPGAPELTDLDRQLAVLRQQIATEDATTTQSTNLARSGSYDQLHARAQVLESLIPSIAASAAVRQAEVDRLGRAVDQIPDKMRVSHDLGREHDDLEKKYEALHDKLMIAAVSVATAKSVPPSIEVVEYGSVPASATSPKTKLLLIAAAIFGVIAGTLLAVLRDRMENRFTIATWTRRAAGPPVYGVVRHFVPPAPGA